MKKIIRQIYINLSGIINYMMPKFKYQLLFHSFPDFSDNSIVVFKHLLNSDNANKYNFIYLYNCDYLDHYDLTDLEISEQNAKSIQFIKKKSIQGLYYFMTSKYVFFTHGIYANIKIPKRQNVINLWHGMPLKNIGLLDDVNKEIVSFSKLVSSSENMNGVMSKAFGINSNMLLNCGLPRTDLLFTIDVKNVKPISDFIGNNKMIFWLPTYRLSDVGDIRNDGNVNENGLPFFTDQLLNDFDICLGLKKNKMLIKLHPMDRTTDISMYKFENILIINDKFIFEHKIHLYSILRLADALLTDYSSIYIDYLQLNRPIGFITDDIDTYKNKRGFVFQQVDWFLPGERIVNHSDLVDFINKFNNKFDDFENKRIEVNNFFNKYSDGKSTKRLIEYLNL